MQSLVTVRMFGTRAAWTQNASASMRASSPKANLFDPTVRTAHGRKTQAPRCAPALRKQMNARRSVHSTKPPHVPRTSRAANLHTPGHCEAIPRCKPAYPLTLRGNPADASALSLTLVCLAPAIKAANLCATPKCMRPSLSFAFAPLFGVKMLQRCNAVTFITNATGANRYKFLPVCFVLQ